MSDLPWPARTRHVVDREEEWLRRPADHTSLVMFLHPLRAVRNVIHLRDICAVQGVGDSTRGEARACASARLTASDSA